MASSASGSGGSHSLSQLRTLLSARGLPSTAHPDEDALQTMLMVAGGDVNEACKLIVESLGAERRISGETTASDPTLAGSGRSQSRRSFEADDAGADGTLPGPALGLGLASRHSRSARGYRNVSNNGNSSDGSTSIVAIVFSALAFPLTLAQGLLVFLARFIPLRAFLPPVLFGDSGVDGRRTPGNRIWKDTDPHKAAERYRSGLEDFIAAESGRDTDQSDSNAFVTGIDGKQGAEAASDEKRGDGLRHRSEQQAPPNSASYPPAPSTSHAGSALQIPQTLLTCSYNDAIKRASEDLKILVVVLESLDHQHCDRFRKEVLLSKGFVDVVNGKDFLLWGGDVSERDAYQVSNLLQVTSYPFVAFISLQPSRNRSVGRSSSSRPPRMAVLSRHEGSPASSTSATVLIDHIQNLLLPRVTPYLQRLQREKERRQRERELREEQDRAFERAAAADAERVRNAREEERLRRQADRRKVEEARREEGERQKYLLWRKWARKYYIPSEPLSGEEGRVKIAVRLPSGKRLERFFSKDTKIERLFAFVETGELEGEEDLDDEDDIPLAAPADFKVQYRFSLISGYPRAKIEPSALTLDQTIAEVEAVKGGASLLAEGVVGLRVSRTIDTTDEDTDH